MSNQLTLFATPNVISSPASEDGALLSNSPGGQPTDQSGRAVRHASHLALLALAWEKLTSGTSGRISETLSASAALQSSLLKLPPQGPYPLASQFIQAYLESVT